MSQSRQTEDMGFQLSRPCCLNRQDLSSREKDNDPVHYRLCWVPCRVSEGLIQISSGSHAQDHLKQVPGSADTEEGEQVPSRHRRDWKKAARCGMRHRSVSFKKMNF